ncbi:hypothetical protein FOL46_001421 [Perkinsus olseni]|uniref:Uncharacterized protein n=1 Tax=Perkinsus olseni TaxID=32597 RepID=A0A7J6MX50_PEROL|nr:hypothetical protein FOL46_001421 [Perkinsus olseni]
MQALRCGDTTAPCVLSELRGPDPATSDSDLRDLCVSGVCLSHTGRIAIGSWMNGEGIYAFDVDSPNEPLGPPFKGHANFRTVKEVSLVGLNQEYVASGSDDGNWFAWRLQQGPSDCDDCPDDGPPSAADPPIDPRLAFVGLEGDLEVVNCVQQHPSEACIVTSGIENDIKVWHPQRAFNSHRGNLSVRADPRLRQIIARNLTQSADSQGLSNFLLTILRRRFPHARNVQRFGSTVVFTRSPSSDSSDAPEIVSNTSPSDGHLSGSSMPYISPSEQGIEVPGASTSAGSVGDGDEWTE